GLVLIFVTDLHHLLLQALLGSYQFFPAGTVPITQDMAATISLTVSKSFMTAVQIAAPFLIVGLVFYLGLGLLARLMPQMQIFFVAMPVQIAIGIMLFAMMIAAGSLFWLNTFQSDFVNFLQPG